MRNFIPFLVATNPDLHRLVGEVIDEATILKLQKAVEAKHDAERERLDAEEKADNAAIKRVLQLLRRHSIGIVGLNHSSEGHGLDVVVDARANTNSSTQMPPANNLLPADPEALVLGTIASFEKPFTFADLMDALRQRIGQEVDRKMVSWVIFRNKHRNIKVVQEGRGRRKALYANAQ